MAVVAVALVGWVVVGAVQLGVAAREALDAADDLRLLRDRLDVADVVAGDDVVGELEAAGGRLEAAHGRLRSPWVAPWRRAPWVGRQVRAAEALAGTGAVSSMALAEVARATSAVARDDGSGAADRVSSLRRVAAVAGAAHARLGSTDLGPDEGLFGPLADARAEAVEARAEAVATLADAGAVAGALGDVLAGPSTYLVLAANNAQMQNGQGMFLSAGLLRAEDGRIHLDGMRSVNELPLPTAPVPLPEDLRARWGDVFDPNTDWRHLGMSHRFAPTAALAADLWESAMGERVDGVLAVDPVAVAAVAAATGPVRVGDRDLDAEQLLHHLLVDQYDAYRDRAPAEVDPGRRDELERLAVSVVGALDRDPDPGALAAAVRDVAGGRHVLVWSRDPGHQRAWVAAGVDGSLGGRELLLSVVNRGGNKLDPHLRVSAELVGVGRDERGGRLLEARVSVTNAAPAGLPRYVEGPHDPEATVAGEYLGVLTLTVPAVAGTPEVVGEATPAVSGPDGATRVAGTWVRVRRGDTTERTFRFRVAPGVDELVVAPSARVPATTWVVGGTRFADDRRVTVAVPAGS